MATTLNQPSSGSNGVVVILAVIIIAIAAVAAVWLMQDHRSGAERVGDAIATAPQGLGKAAKKLDDQPPGKNVERNLDDAAQKVQ